MKKTFTKIINGAFYAEADYGCKQKPIDELIDFLEEAKKYGATHMNFSGSCDDGSCDSIEIQPIMQYLETEAQEADREAKEKANLENIERRRDENEKMEYERLKQKFETSNRK